MCGLVGFLGGIASQDKIVDEALLRKMTNSIIYRGPDDSGSWIDLKNRVGLGHRRLSILDLSLEGHQPMQSLSSRYVIAYNGEIYNHLDLRKEIDLCHAPAADKTSSAEWRGHSDTESLLAGFDAWGIKGTVDRARGMFAFAVWDRKKETLTLARDRVGEKPLYYGWQGRGNDAVFLFGSELKALRVHPAFEKNINRGAISLLLRHNCIPAPYSIYEGVHKLLPGSLLSVSLRDRSPKISTYWSGAQIAEEGTAQSSLVNPEQAVDELEALLMKAVGQQMIADVPLGAFLSGGVDSSTVVALMQAQSSNPVKTFSIGFEVADYNEAEVAKAVAGHLATDHTELYVTEKEAMDVIPRLPALYDEPFSDSSQIPTFLVSQLARQHVSVSLSGDAGDELFCGYNRYQMTENVWRKLSRVPILFRKLAAKGITCLSPQTWNRLSKKTKYFFPEFLQMANMGDKLHKGAEVLDSVSEDELYLGLSSHWNDPASVVINGSEPSTLLTGTAPSLNGLNGVERMMALDLLTYLPDDILVKLDRAAMAVSLETRVPFLDHRVVEFAWNLPQSMKLRDGQTKWILRQVLYKFVPRKLTEGPKRGFGVPLQEWLRGPLRDWAEALLDESRLRREGYFHPQVIRKKWTEHLSLQRNWAYDLWDILMFQSWLEQQ